MVIAAVDPQGNSTVFVEFLIEAIPYFIRAKLPPRLESRLQAVRLV